MSGSRRGAPPDVAADFKTQIALPDATANGVVHQLHLPPVSVKPGETAEVRLNWLAQQQADESYTIFVISSTATIT